MTGPLDSCRCHDLVADLAWAAEAVGSPVVAHDHLVGGISSTVLRCRFADRADPLVLRVIDDRALLAREPDIIDREAEALGILARSTLVTPALIASHDAPDVGRLLMTWLEGRIVIDREDLDQRVPAVAALAAEIAATPLPAGHRLSPWRSWARANPEPPSWGDAGLWRHAIAFHRAGEPPSLTDGAVVLLHRDLHPLNILWSDGPAVVDWVNACVGHPHAELGHCRWNLAVTAGPVAADRFLDHYMELTDDRAYGPYSRWWDVDSLLDKLPGPGATSAWRAVGRADLTTDRVAAATDAFLRRVLRGAEQES